MRSQRAREMRSQGLILTTSLAVMAVVAVGGAVAASGEEGDGDDGRSASSTGVGADKC